MICIKANDLPRQSIKLARNSAEERKRYLQHVSVSDASSNGWHYELRHGETLNESLLTDSRVTFDTCPETRTTLQTTCHRCRSVSCSTIRCLAFWISHSPLTRERMKADCCLWIGVSLKRGSRPRGGRPVASVCE